MRMFGQLAAHVIPSYFIALDKNNRAAPKDSPLPN